MMKMKSPVPSRLGQSITAALALLVAGAGARPARAAGDPRELEAKTACLAGRPEKGIELLAELYAATNDPTYIYNQGRCFEQNGKAAEAVTRFREYLRKAQSLPAPDRAEVQAHIDAMEAESKAATPAPAPVAPAPPPVGTPAPPATVVAPVAGMTDVENKGNPSAGRQLRTAGIVTASAGALVLLGGVYMGLRARSLSQEVTSDANDGKFSQSKYDDGQSAATLQWVGYGVGAAALIAGGVMLIYGERRPSEAGVSVAALPDLAPGRAGGALRVTF